MNLNIVPRVESVQSKKHCKKIDMSFIESLRFVFSSSYILKIGVIVVSYSMAMSLIEIYFMNMVRMFWLESTITGFAATNAVSAILMILMSLFVGGLFHFLNIEGSAIKRFGWTFTALLTAGLINNSNQ
jgi:AAA family ATP:ADP antiporter